MGQRVTRQALSHPIPFFRESGVGPAVVCLHSSASASGQWRALAERLCGRYRVLAADLYGEGRTAPWPGTRPMRLDDELALLAPVFATAGERFHLVGHSFGGAVALKAALVHRDRLLSLALYEPVAFGVLTAEAPDGDATREIAAVRDDTTRLVGEGRLEEAAARFIDYWMGDGAWAATPPDSCVTATAGVTATARASRRTGRLCPRNRSRPVRAA
jgi:pimeloyl-ACP methyl ester carboxylesterase